MVLAFRSTIPRPRPWHLGLLAQPQKEFDFTRVSDTGGICECNDGAFDGDGALLVVAYAREGENGGEGEARAWARVERNTSINRRPS